MTTKKPLQTIGRAEKVLLTDWKIEVPAKVDTGAESSSLWATGIVEKKDGLHFMLFGPDSPLYSGAEIIVPKGRYTQTRVTNSFGHKELRYKVKLRIRLKDRKIRATFTLSNRAGMVYPMLIGRRLLYGKFVVDVRSGKPLLEEESRRDAVLRDDLEKLNGGKKGLKIAILSKGPGNYSTRRLKEVARARGHDVRVINYAQCYVSIEKGKPLIKYRGETLGNFDAIIPRIAQSYTKYGTAIVRQFEAQDGMFTTASSLAINRSRDKLRAYQVLAKAGVGIPKTVFARETASFEDVIELAGGAPVVIKVARGTHGNGVVLAETIKAAKAVMQAFYVEGVNFLVQEFVKESAGEDIRALVVGNRVVASVIRKSLDGDFRSNTHQGGQGMAVKLTAEERKTAVKAARAMGLPICGVDMMRSDQGPLILEVNSSASIKTPEMVTGRDIATKIIEYVETNAKLRHRKDKIGV